MNMLIWNISSDVERHATSGKYAFSIFKEERNDGAWTLALNGKVIGVNDYLDKLEDEAESFIKKMALVS